MMIQKCMGLLVLLIGAGATGSISGQEITPDEAAAIRTSARASMDRWGAPGMVLAAVRGDASPYVLALGVSNVETGARMRADMAVSAASVSKVVTAVTALTLAHKGLLDLHRPVGQYLPKLPPGLAALTLEQLLSHTAGLGEGTPGVQPLLSGALSPVCAAMTDDAFVADRGVAWGYTNMGFTLAGCVMEAVGGRPFALVVDEHVFAPLGMTHSTFDPLQAMTWDHAQGHDTRGAEPVVVRPFNSYPNIMPAGELITTVGDLARLATALLHDGLLDGARVLPSGILHDMATAHGHGGPFYAEVPDYGLGLHSRDADGLHILEHAGVYDGFGASFALAPERDLAVIAATDGRYSAPMMATQNGLEILSGKAPSPVDRRILAVSPADSADALGRYQALGSPFEIGTVDHRLSLVIGTRSFPLVQRPQGYLAIPDFPPYLPLSPTPLELVRDGRGHVTFVRLGWRLYRRVNDEEEER